MIKKLLIVSILLTSSVNADIFQALKDAASKAVEAQNRLKNQSEGSTTSSDQSSPPQFNSLAEEAAYKKQQEQLIEKRNKFETQKSEQEFKEKHLPRIKAIQDIQANFVAKYFVKNTDTPEIIDNKFKNRVQLTKQLLDDYITFRSESGRLYNMLENDESFAKICLAQTFIPDNIKLEDNANYVDLYKGSNIDYTDHLSSNIRELGIDRNNLESLRQKYEEYLKFAYSSYEDRQKEAKAQKEREIQRAKEDKEWQIKQKEQQIQHVQLKKEQETKLAKERQERQKVQGACQAWRAKANKGVYSLGVGDKISCGDSLVFVIQAVNANTFTVLLPYYNKYIYKEKSMCIPAASLSSAPSPYCYR